MYCKTCGGEITKEINANGELVNEFEHRQCDSKLRHCNYCGKKESNDNRHYGNGNWVFCQRPRDENGYYIGDGCGDFFHEMMRVEKFAPYKNKLPKFNEYLQELFIGTFDGDDCEDFDADEFVNDVNNHDGYIVWYNDSDGRQWYRTVPNNIEVLKYVVENEHRVTLGMGCNQYVECVIYQGEQFEIDII